MEVAPVGLVAIALWCVFAWRGGLIGALAYTVCLAPFGMAAAANLPALGDLSLLVFQVCAAMTIGLALADKASQAEPFAFRLPASAVILIALTIYGLLAGFVMPRAMRGEFLVFSLSRGAQGVSVGPFGSTVVPIAPSAANLSQGFYFTLSVAFFVTAYSVMNRPNGARIIHGALAVTTFIHGALAVLDATKLPQLLDFFRTANYALLDDHAVAGLPRIIGGFPEASSFGSFSVTMLAYVLVHFLMTFEKRSAAAAVVAGACSVASFSSTAYLGVFFLMAYATLVTLARIVMGRMHWTAATWIGLGAYLFAVVVIAVLVATPVGQVFDDVIDRLLLSKATSSSALERGAWSDYGFKTMWETFGIGAGLGSIRSNGYAGVFLGSVGIVGTALMLAFAYLAFVRGPGPVATASPARAAIFAAARAAGLTALAMGMVSSTIPDPGLVLMLLAALAELARAAPASEAPPRRAPDAPRRAPGFEQRPRMQ